MGSSGLDEYLSSGRIGAYGCGCSSSLLTKLGMSTYMLVKRSTAFQTARILPHAINEIASEDQHILQYVCPFGGRLEDALRSIVAKEKCTIAVRIALDCLSSLFLSDLVNGFDFL